MTGSYLLSFNFHHIDWLLWSMKCHIFLVLYNLRNYFVVLVAEDAFRVN